MTLEDLIKRECGNSVTIDTIGLIKVDDTTYIETLGLSDEDKIKINGAEVDWYEYKENKKVVINGKTE